jgi:hypothetical protein
MRILKAVVILLWVMIGILLLGVIIVNLLKNIINI